MKVAFIGLGVMGYPMAGHLANAGHDVTVYNRTATKAEQWCQQYKGNRATTPAEAARNAEIVFTCVGNDDDLRQVVAGPQGVFSSMAQNAILVDHTTASAEVARELAVIAADKGLQFLDAPVSGGQAGAENGVLSIMIGGEPAVYERAAAVIDCYAKSAKLLGPAGSGQLAKMVNQICIAGLVQGLAEGVHFAKQAGLDAAAVFDVIQHGAAGSWQMVNRHQTMIDDQFDFGFAVDWMRKDLKIALDEARSNGAQLPVTALVDQFYSEVQKMGGNRWDTSSLVKRLDS
ncbi:MULTISPECIES: NAD(P)-dependent oxidoreductase [Amphritea]|jgi:3-hydroxyisobutyrate dehydrogenase-like beta-hydroxyacid dehydrogenase|uniref:3-hydroxyisobutyrate dehydrogenase n=2 Tax=Amphritea TaxID=515417 RepID=A0A1H9IKK8_9GAMM|nr:MULTISPECIES: NAD(P)-dependent oxidoreductase [Amphritea]MBN0987946.1 NAD(P)-dependent oxidoreductase [Amphritea pacifica]MBN1005470.1 NAD(P)-dependent oxidoreductase [Amphritea pacifica]SEQ75140.1 3-hydroxyisobutyrate dehydrogenase [Amphritea atlantica]